MKTAILTAALALCATMTATAQENEPRFSIAPTGRILIDGALFCSPQKESFADGAAIPEVRVGAKMSYGQWDALVDIGFAYNKVGMRDVYVRYNFNDSQLLQIGSFVHQYGLQSATSSSMKVCMEEPVSNAVFEEDFRLGAMYEYADNRWLATASVHFDANATTTVLLTPDHYTREAYGFCSRLVVHPICEPGKVVQVGISGGYATPANREDKTFDFEANFPTRVVRVQALNAVVDKAHNLWKFTPELLLSYGPVALEAQYYYQRVNRFDGRSPFTSQGAYALCRGLLTGGSYGYALKPGALATPKKGSLEAVMMYSYTNLTDVSAGVWGGRANDLSFTLNYYINRYVIARLHYGYTHVWDNAAGRRDMNGFMARLQVIF